ncbi:MAG: hypothetical protein ACI9DC_000137 [Gammaproteobacteria bacterium]|jgi:hypothetical protein
MLQILFRRSVIVALTGLLLGACQQASVREEADSPAELSLEKARALVAEFETARLTSPPRTIANVRRLLGSGRKIPSDGPQRQLDRRQQAEQGQAALADIHAQYDPSHTASSFGSFAVLGLAERAFDVGDFRRAIQYTEQGTTLSRYVEAPK